VSIIANAIIIRIDKHDRTDAESKAYFTDGVPARIPCFLAPYSETKWQLGATIKDCSETIFIMDDDLVTVPTESRPVIGDRVVAKFVDESDNEAVHMLVVLARPNKFGSLSHLELFLKKV